MTCAVVTPWTNHIEFAGDYFRALECGPMPDETIVVDNASSPPLDFGTIRSEVNLGFARGSNLGLRAAQSDVVVFLNNDVAATQSGWLQELADAAEPGVLVGQRMRHDKHGDVDGHHLPYLDGWCLGGMRTDLLRLGGFNDDMEEPAYYSDNLLCLEARAVGMHLMSVPVGLIHLTNGSISEDDWPHVRAVTARNYEVFAARARELLVPA